MAQYYLGAKDFNLNKIGFKDNKQIFAHPNLSKKRYEIFRAALKKKKDGFVRSVRVSSLGEVSVKLINSESFVKILSISSLEDECNTIDVEQNEDVSFLSVGHDSQDEEDAETSKDQS